MNAQNFDNQPKKLKETKNKIKVDFERSPLKDRLKAKFLSLFFLKKIAWFIVRFILLVGIAYIVLFPFFSQISSSLMDAKDFADPTVNLIPKHFTLQIYKAIWIENHYMEAFFNTLLLSLVSALLQTFVCCFIAYGLAKFKFKGNKFVFMAVILSLVIPHQTLQLAMFRNFRYFDLFGIFGFLDGGGLFGTKLLAGVVDIFPETEAFRIFEPDGINLLGTYWPMIILSISGLAFKNGLYIFLLRQFFKGVPDELEESAYIDGSGIINTFFRIILPISVPMMITVFLFSFSWQWTDEFYTNLFFGGTIDNKLIFMKDIDKVPASLTSSAGGSDEGMYTAAVRNTCGIMIMIPLIIMYLFCQKYLVQGIERSGLTAD